MDRRKLWIAAAVAAAIVVLVAGSLLTRGRRDAGTGTTSQVASGEASQAVPGSTEAPGVTSSTAPASGPQGATGTPQTTTQGTSGGSVPGAAGAQPAENGSKLTTVTAPPRSTLAMIDSSAGAAGDTFAIGFRPYGKGPVRGSGSTLVVRIMSARASNTNTSDFAIRPGTNALVDIAQPIAGLVKIGGSYTGTLEMVRYGDVLVLRLIDAHAVEQP